MKVSDKMIEISKQTTIFELTNQYPEIKEILFELGFTDIIKPGMIHTAGRVMTLEKGAKMKKIALEVIAQKFSEYGYLVI